MEPFDREPTVPAAVREEPPLLSFEQVPAKNPPAAPEKAPSADRLDELEL